MKRDKKKLAAIHKEFSQHEWFHELEPEDKDYCVEMQYDIDFPFVNDVTNTLLNMSILQMNREYEFVQYLNDALPYTKEKGWDFNSPDIRNGNQKIRILKQEFFSQRLAHI